MDRARRVPARPSYSRLLSQRALLLLPASRTRFVSPLSWHLLMDNSGYSTLTAPVLSISNAAGNGRGALEARAGCFNHPSPLRLAALNERQASGDVCHPPVSGQHLTASRWRTPTPACRRERESAQARYGCRQRRAGRKKASRAGRLCRPACARRDRA